MIKRIDTFWFESRSSEALAAWRVCFGLYLLHLLLISLPNWSRYYGVNGTYPLWMLRAEGRDIWSVMSLSDSPLLIWAVFLAMFVAASFFTLGLFARAACVVLFVGYSSMMARNIYMVNGQDQVATVLLFFACFAPLSASLSLDCRRRKMPQIGATQSIWPLRLMQVSFAGIYLFCGPTKLETWADGEALYYISLSHDWFRFPELSIFRQMGISQLLSFTTIAVESLFPLLVCFRKTRPWILWAIALMHLGIMLFLAPSVFYFNAIMVISLLLFVDNNIFQNLYRNHLKRREYVKRHPEYGLFNELRTRVKRTFS
jgi:hypothetical protein